VQGDKTGDVPLSEIVKKYIKEKYNKPGDVFLGVVHRLDRPVSGAVIFARTSKALTRLNEMIRDRKLYPLVAYLDAADLSLARDKANLDTLTKRMADKDEGMRWWAIVGLHLLDRAATPAGGVLKRALKDESHEVRMIRVQTI
jgi:23S rRNA-/tRNA-specific pseudouridylate synthase